MKTDQARANGRTSHNRWQYEATLSREWLKENLPEVFQRIRRRALKRYPRPRKVKTIV